MEIMSMNPILSESDWLYFGDSMHICYVKKTQLFLSQSLKLRYHQVNRKKTSFHPKKTKTEQIKRNKNTQRKKQKKKKKE